MNIEDKKYIEEILPKKLNSDFYFDNPSAAVDDIEYLLKIIKQLQK